MKILRKINCWMLVFSILISTLYIPVTEAKTLGTLKEELTEYKAEYEANRLEAALSQQEINELKATINTLDTEIYNIGEEIVSLTKEIEQLDEEIEETRQEINNIMAFVQIQNGEQAYLEYAFGAQTFTDFIYRIAVSEQITTHNEQLIEQFNLNIQEAEEMQVQLATKKASLADKQVELAVEIKKIESDLQQLDELNLDIEELIAAKESEIKILVDNGCTDSQTLQECQLSVLPSDTSFWRPTTAGYVTSWYGPRTGSSVMSSNHMGIDLSASGSDNYTTPIYPIASGVVVYMTNYSSGCSPKRVYIQHSVNGQLYISGYLHLHAVYVSEGDYVSKDSVIGIMGGGPGSNDTCSTGTHLHLEISTGSFTAGTYYSNRYNPTISVNFPSTLYSTVWSSRSQQF